MLGWILLSISIGRGFIRGRRRRQVEIPSSVVNVFGWWVSTSDDDGVSAIRQDGAAPHGLNSAEEIRIAVKDVAVALLVMAVLNFGGGYEKAYNTDVGCPSPARDFHASGQATWMR